MPMLLLIPVYCNVVSLLPKYHTSIAGKILFSKMVKLKHFQKLLN